MESNYNQKLGKILKLLIEFRKGNYEVNQEIPEVEDTLLVEVISAFKFLGKQLSHAEKIRVKAEKESEELINELSKRYNELMQFSYIVSHNLRTPVVQILGLAQFLELEEDEDEKSKLINYLKSSAKSLDELIKDLNVILSAKSSLSEKVESFKISYLIQNVINQLDHEIKNANANIKVIIKDGIDEIATVKSYLHSIIFNLVANAIKYKSPNRLPFIKLEIEKYDKKIIISVEDNGSGINLNIHKDRIFAFYSRVNELQEGKGLGLYMTKSQIESLGGTIDVESELDVGTKFTVSL